MRSIDVSIVIVSWNTRDILRRCLRSICRHAKGIRFEVIVVDNASADGSSRMVREEFPSVILVENEKNRGFAAGNNQGMALARGRYLLLLNSDTTVLDNALVTLVSFADAHARAAVVGCRVLNPDRTLQPTCFMFPSVLNMVLSSSYLYKVFPRSRFFGRERMTWWARDDQREVDVVTGCIMLVRSEAIAEVGVLDERFFMYGEETDWCYRLKQAGWKVMFTPAAEIIHMGGQSSKQREPEMILQRRGSVLEFLRKHNSRFEYGVASLLAFLFFSVRIPFWMLRSSLRRADHDYSRMKLRAYCRGAKLLLSGRGKDLCCRVPG